MRGNETGGKAGFIREARGFTLVELIVVIAILAVLAGVAYPVYTGYIQKANEAADQVLLGAVNEAFASALIDAGYTDGLPADVEVGSSGVINLVKGTRLIPSDSEVPANLDVTDDPSIDSAFTRYYSGNAETAFKVFETLIYDPATGGFGGSYDNIRVLGNGKRMTIKDNGNGTTTYTVDNVDYTLNNADVDTFNNSSYGKNMEMSSLMGEVDNVVQALKTVVGASSYSSLESLLGDDYRNSLGLDRTNYPDGPDGDEQYAQALTNAIVMMVAEHSAGLTAEDVATNSSAYQDLDMLSQMAAVYGLATAYANSDVGKDSTIVVDGKSMTVKEYYDSQSKALRELSNPSQGITVILGMLQNLQNSEKFPEYQASSSYTDDLNGYFAAMNALSGNRDSLVEQGALDKGFSDEDLGSILDALFGAN